MDNKDLNEKESLKNNNKNLIYSLIGAAIVCCFLIYIAFFFYRKNKSKKLDKIDIPLVESTPQNNYSELFEEVVLLAKQNKQEFLTRFNDLYPDFTRKILLLNNNIQSSELRFCAYLYLNFSTKDIAEYTFTSVRTVQTKKYNLRKKLNIPTDIDIYVWFSDLLK
ncbi:hypothetical protein ACM46_11130 [Chryseobacterium angstadtii]|uniref:Uncharacterized protein n=1 Tax=Chryseobacterium angstadtii TaxID=558151 RepID=A0A0J7IGI1_9FLAO|nr:hypothetical protein ACM46_11130 [Chryseobacterium angstadtii]